MCIRDRYSSSLSSLLFVLKVARFSIIGISALIIFSANKVAINDFKFTVLSTLNINVSQLHQIGSERFLIMQDNQVVVYRILAQLLK